ncbi:hypothetical protein EsHS_00002165 [Epichloe bromicola]
MDDRPRGKDRPFRPATVGACHVQTATDRFGQEAKSAILDRERISMGLHPAGAELPINWPGSDSEDSEFDDVPASSIYKLVPAMQPYRNNLTALSQKCNVGVHPVSSRSRIFVYVPRSVPRQTIPRHPDAQLITYPSRVAYLIGGYIDPDSPHMINHLVVGSLGQEEIVVTCHDDGDVTAFYTKDVAEYILRNSDIPPAATPKQRRTSSSAASRWNAPKPFFQENVGISAWGLAIHEQSRLIAVSSNRSEVTVFAPALAARGPQALNCDCDSCCEGVQERVRRRARNWRIVVSLGPLASNIPNISFVDDKHGNANKISAIDIKGAMWLADIWNPKQAAIKVMPSTSSLLKSEEFWPASSRGWGILALANKYFLTVHSEEELLGAPLKDLEIVPKLQASPHPMVNIARYIRDLPDNPCTHPVVPIPLLRPSNTSYPIPAGVADEPTDGESDFDAVGQSDEDDDEDADLDESLEVDDAGSDEHEEDDEDEDDDDDDNDMLYPITAADAGGGGVTLESDVSPELASQQNEESLTTPVVEPTVAATMAGEVPVPGENVDVPISETAIILETLFTNLLTPPDGSQSSCVSPSTAGSTEDNRAPFSHCLKGVLPHHAPALLDMVYMPHSGEVCEIPRQTVGLARLLRRPTVYNEISQGYISGLGKFAERYHMLRMYEKDIEMRPLDKANQKGLPEYGILCPYALTMGLSPGRAMRPHFQATSRLNVVVHIPELFLIVIGSSIGRVVLVTPTRLAHAIEKWPGVLHHGLRLEWVLPRESDEAVFRTNKRPLHGMAVSPVQDDGVMGRKDEKQRGAVPRRYRLMLHYRNHDILTYELSREEQTGKVCIF